MAYVTIHKDITKIKNTSPIGLPYLQTACLAVGAGIGFVVYFFASKHIGTSLASILMLVTAAPFVILGMYKDMSGKNAFEIAPLIFDVYIRRAKPRPYISENLYELMEKQKRYEKEIRDVIQNDKTEQERKAKERAKKLDRLPPALKSAMTSTSGNKKNGNKSEKSYKPSADARKKLEEIKHKYRKNPKSPDSAQDSIPYRAMYKNGIIQVTDDYYSKTVEFTDTTYTVASNSDKAAIFDNWCNLLNSFDPKVHVQMSYINQNINKSEYMASIDIPLKNDVHDRAKKEYSDYLKEQLEKGNNGIVKKRYMTIGVHAAGFDKAKIMLNKICTASAVHFAKMGVAIKELNAEERLNVLWNIMHPNENRIHFNFRWEDLMHTGNTTKDIIAPASFDFRDSRRLDAKNYFKINEHTGCCSYIDILTGDYPDTALQEILNIESSIIVTVHIESIDQQEARKFVKRQLSDVNSKKIDEQKKAARSGYDMDILPPELKMMSEDAELIFQSLEKEGQHLFHCTFMIVQMDKSKKELDNAYENIKSILQTLNCNIYKLAWNQENAFMSALPLGLNKIDVSRGLLTSELAVFLPFNTKELFQTGEIKGHRVQPVYYGLNALSNNMIMCDRKILPNPNGLILGQPGSGKSFAGKREILNVFFVYDDDILILDPESEYTSIVNLLNGQVLKLSLNSSTYINPMEINLDTNNDEDKEYDPISQKADFISSLLETMLGGKNGLSIKELSIIDRCTRKVYAEYIKNPVPENMPVLEDLYKELLKDKNPEGRELAVTMEMYINGSYNLFNHRSNVDINNRIVCFDIKELTGKLKNIGMLIIQDKIWNRVTVNRAAKKSTRVYIDEFHLLLKDSLTSNYTVEMWKRFRKWGGIPTGLTQNVSDFLASRDIESIFKNSLFLLLLSQSPDDAGLLAGYYQISENQLKYCTDVEPGSGLIVYGTNCILPFKDEFPKDTIIYSILTTKLEETLQQ